MPVSQFRSHFFALSRFGPVWRRPFLPLLFCLVFAGLGDAAALTPTALRCDRMQDPLGVDSRQPLLSWQHEDTGTRGARQSAWQILAANTLSDLAGDQGTLWDSGRVAGSSQNNVAYRGEGMQESFKTLFWKVRVWDEKGEPGPWSEAATWTTGLLAPEDWKASWITDPELLPLQREARGYRSDIHLDPTVPQWLSLDLGTEHSIDSVRLQAIKHDFVDGYGFPVRFVIEAGLQADFSDALPLLDQSESDYPNAWATSIATKAPPVTARYVRLRVQKMRSHEDGRACFALSQVQVFSKGTNVALGARVEASEVGSDPGWSPKAVVDGLGALGEDPRANSTLLVRREFTVGEGLRRALIAVCGLGHHELRLNGQGVSDALLATPWTRYQSRCQYELHNITDALRPGSNVLSAVVAGGFYNVQAGRYTKLTTPFRPLLLIASLRLEYEDGRVETIGTGDGAWHCARGPIVFSNMYSGEDYDARLEQPGWDRPGFVPATPWRSAVTVPGPGGSLRGASESAPPIRVHATLAPVSVRELSPTRHVYDLGQNASLLPRIRVSGPSGARVRITLSELVNERGEADQRSVLHGGKTWCSYTLAGKGEEVWAPKFFYQGARYVQVDLEGVQGGSAPTLLSVKGLVIHSSAAFTGSFDCSNSLFKRIRELVLWAQRSNSFHVLTDCPHRERLGWIEQTYLNGPALRYEMDQSRLLRKALNDMADSQTGEGLIPSINPEYVVFPGGFRDSPEWGSAFILTAWQQYVWTGDWRFLESHYQGMKRYLSWLDSKASHHILDHGLGDWYDLGPKRPGSSQLTPVALTATATYAHAAQTLSEIAKLLGNHAKDPDAIALYAADRDRYARQAVAIGEAFNKRFFDEERARYGTGSQTSLAVPLALGLVPEDCQEEVLASLLESIHQAGDSITTGDIGYRYLLRSLADNGHSGLVAQMNNQTEKPGYGYQLVQGCTSLAESWTAEPNSSQNHFMLGQITEWFYADLAGIRPDPENPAWANALIAPTPLAGIAWVEVSQDTPRGRFHCAWRREGSDLSVELSIPPNASATLRLPHNRGALILESGGPVRQAQGVALVQPGAKVDIFTVTSGKYRFRTQFDPE